MFSLSELRRWGSVAGALLWPLSLGTQTTPPVLADQRLDVYVLPFQAYILDQPDTTDPSRIRTLENEIAQAIERDCRGLETVLAREVHDVLTGYEALLSEHFDSPDSVSKALGEIRSQMSNPSAAILIGRVERHRPLSAVAEITLSLHNPRARASALIDLDLFSTNREDALESVESLVRRLISQFERAFACGAEANELVPVVPAVRTALHALSIRVGYAQTGEWLDAGELGGQENVYAKQTAINVSYVRPIVGRPQWALNPQIGLGEIELLAGESAESAESLKGERARYLRLGADLMYLPLELGPNSLYLITGGALLLLPSGGQAEVDPGIAEPVPLTIPSGIRGELEVGGGGRAVLYRSLGIELRIVYVVQPEANIRRRDTSRNTWLQGFSVQFGMSWMYQSFQPIY